jgi:glycosyltransferase involved in cell wall biosynthesis
MTQRATSEGGLRLRLRRGRARLRRTMSMLRSRAQLRKVDSRPIGDLDGKLLLFAKARNEALRLPYFLDYYLSRGVDRVFLIDNGSDDATPELALANPRVHLFRTLEPFRYYANWMEILLERFGRGRWCIAADVDEIFYYPDAERVSLKALCAHLDATGQSAVLAVLLDMYSDRPISQNDYRPGQKPWEVCRYFDPRFSQSVKRSINQKTQRRFDCPRFSGNMRQRMFGADANLTKVPLFRYGRAVYAAPGMHAMDGVEFGDLRGAVLHFKYLQDFNTRVIEEAARGQYAGNAAHYRKYAARVQSDGDVNCFWEQSVTFEGSNQLVQLGLMHSTPAYQAMAENCETSVESRRPGQSTIPVSA